MARQGNLWTKNGRPLYTEGNEVYAPSGAFVGRIRGDRVFGVEGDSYVGSLVDNRLVFRSYDIDGPERPYVRTVSADDPESVEPARMWGDEPVVPD